MVGATRDGRGGVAPAAWRSTYRRGHRSWAFPSASRDATTGRTNKRTDARRFGQYGMNRQQAGSNAEPAVRAQIGRAFAQTVRSLRCEVGISQERLALGVGINRAHLAGLERGVHTPTLYTMCRLLPGLHVTFVEFVQEFERILKQPQPQPKKSSPYAGAPRRPARLSGPPGTGLSL